jgi:hypothetical protein
MLTPRIRKTKFGATSTLIINDDGACIVLSKGLPKLVKIQATDANVFAVYVTTNALNIHPTTTIQHTYTPANNQDTLDLSNPRCPSNYPIKLYLTMHASSQ